MLLNEGDLWDYAYAGTGGRKEIKVAAPGYDDYYNMWNWYRD